jgi:GT2 family glycosyltransferase
MGGLARESEIREYLSSILAVMVCYRQRIETTDTLLSFSSELRLLDTQLDILIYDNSPVPMLASSSCLPAGYSFTYLHDPSNPGVSKAYNKGAEIARSRGKKWLLLLDQDTTFTSDALAKYFRGFQTAPHAQMFAPILKSNGMIVSPCFFRSGFGFPLSTLAPGSLRLRNRSVLNSGMMVGLMAFETIKGFNEQIALDFADHDFCRRFSKYFQSAYILDITCEHSFSNATKLDLNRALDRFSFFCRGARHCVITLTDYLSYTLVVFVRCLMLSLKYRTTRFIPMYVHSYLLDRKVEASNGVEP